MGFIFNPNLNADSLWFRLSPTDCKLELVLSTFCVSDLAELGCIWWKCEIHCYIKDLDGKSFIRLKVENQEIIW